MDLMFGLLLVIGWVLALVGCGAVVVLAVLWRGERGRSARLQNIAEVRKQRLLNERDLLLNTLSESFILLNSRGVIRFANEPARGLMEGRRILDRRYDEIFLDERFTRPIEEAMGTGREVEERLILHGNASPLGSLEQRGETAWLLNVSLLKRPLKKPLVRIIIRDITAEHQAEQVRKDFVANASHELRTPLAIINGYLENLLDDELVEETELTRRFLRIMRKHGERIALIVEDMLMISKLESGESSILNRESFPLEKCVQDVLERLEPVIASQEAEICLRLEADQVMMYADRFYWTQILFNLIENALKQNAQGEIRVEIGCQLGGEELVIWVEDSGVGIPSSDLPFVFKRFYRVNKHHSQNEVKGTGLGLSIVKRAVEAHGGCIEVHSEPGVSTRFEMRLPLGVISGREEVGQLAGGA